MIRLKFNKICELRIRRGIRSDAQLAKLSGWDPGHFNRVKKKTQRGEFPSITLDKLDGLCGALRCRVSAIIEHRLDPPGKLVDGMARPD